MSARNMFPRYIQESKVISGGKWTTWPFFFWSQLHLLMPKISPPSLSVFCSSVCLQKFILEEAALPFLSKDCLLHLLMLTGIGRRWVFICHILVLSHFVREVLKLVKRRDLQSKKQKASPVIWPGCLTSYPSSRWDQGGFCAVQQPGHLSLHGECQHEVGNRSDVNQSLCHCQLPCHHGSNK